MQVERSGERRKQLTSASQGSTAVVDGAHKNGKHKTQLSPKESRWGTPANNGKIFTAVACHGPRLQPREPAPRLLTLDGDQGLPAVALPAPVTRGYRTQRNTPTKLKTNNIRYCTLYHRSNTNATTTAACAPKGKQHRRTAVSTWQSRVRRRKNKNEKVTLPSTLATQNAAAWYPGVLYCPTNRSPCSAVTVERHASLRIGKQKRDRDQRDQRKKKTETRETNGAKTRLSKMLHNSGKNGTPLSTYVHASKDAAADRSDDVTRML